MHSRPRKHERVARTRPCIRADIGPSARGRNLSARMLEKKKLKNSLLAAGKERKKMFGFRISIPKIPKIPKIPEIPEFTELRGRSREKKKVFLA
jgi:hypothetical protein